MSCVDVVCGGPLRNFRGLCGKEHMVRKVSIRLADSDVVGGYGRDELVRVLARSLAMAVSALLRRERGRLGCRVLVRHEVDGEYVRFWLDIADWAFE